MPTYQFRCPDGTIVERVFSFSEVPASIPSPDGTGEAVRIISGGAGLIFKGSGFYITDYGKDGKKDQRDAAAKSDAAKTDAKSYSKPESKPAGGEGGASTAASKTESSSGGSATGGGSGKTE
jgi:predicted nucleic acid-binding Zn ribbon protein